MTGLGPLGDGARVIVVGGGPGGAACALALLRGARVRHRRIEVLILTPEHARGRSQAVGVLSPPLQRLLREEVGVCLPATLLQRGIAAYALYGEASRLRLPLSNEGNAEGTFVSPRAELDAFLLDAARAAGATVIGDRVRDVEFGANDVRVYSENGCITGDVLVGAFGLDPTLGRAFAARRRYTPPPHLEATVARVYPSADSSPPVLVDDTVHAFLPRLDAFEFGALIPNVNYTSVVAAGLHLGDAALEEFLSLAAVRDLLGAGYEVCHHVRSTFPNGLARGARGDRFVCAGDAAGLVRPFKGKGIYAAAVTGIRAARTMLDLGISSNAFAEYSIQCRDLVQDVQYGRLVRILALMFAKRLSFDAVLDRAREDAALRRALFLAVSGHGNSREILCLGAQPRTAAQLIGDSARYVWSRSWLAGATNKRRRIYG